MVQGGPEEPDPKRPHYETGAEDAGLVAGTVCSIGSHASQSGPFEPAALAKSKEGSFKPPEELTTFMSKHFKRCLKKEEREAMFKDHPCPDISAATVPKADKYITDFLGKRFPKNQDAELMKVQAVVLGITRPLASAWKELHEARATKDASATVPAAEVMHLIQHTLCLVGNASEYIFQTRRAHILEHINKSWSRYASDEFPDAEETLFGDAFKSSLSERVEKDTALAKAVSITRNRQKEVSSDSDRKGGGKEGQFFRPGPPARYGDRQGRFQISDTVQSTSLQSEGEIQSHERRDIFPGSSLQISTPIPTLREKKPDISNAKHKPVKSPTEVLELLRSLPPSLLPNLNIILGLEVIREHAQTPVGGCLSLFRENWQQITTDSGSSKRSQVTAWIFHSIPKQVLPPKEPAMSWEKAQAMTQEVNNLASKCAIRPVAPHSPGFYSPVFLVPKSDGSWRPVINLKELNRHVVHHHFKMEGIRMLQGLIQEVDWLVKLDLKDAYLTVPITSNH